MISTRRARIARDPDGQARQQGVRHGLVELQEAAEQDRAGGRRSASQDAIAQGAGSDEVAERAGDGLRIGGDHLCRAIGHQRNLALGERDSHPLPDDQRALAGERQVETDMPAFARNKHCRARTQLRAEVERRGQTQDGENLREDI
jgi:hypothetical protein